MLSGYTPAEEEVLAFVRSLQPSGTSSLVGPASAKSKGAGAIGAVITGGSREEAASRPELVKVSKAITYVLHGQTCSAPNASVALVSILRSIVARDPSRIPELARAVSGSKVNHIGRSPDDINPAKPHLARAVEIAPGWLVGLNIANRTKAEIIRMTCELYGLRMPDDLDVSLPNA